MTRVLPYLIALAGLILIVFALATAPASAAGISQYQHSKAFCQRELNHTCVYVRQSQYSFTFRVTSGTVFTDIKVTWHRRILRILDRGAV